MEVALLDTATKDPVMVLLAIEGAVLMTKKGIIKEEGLVEALEDLVLIEEVVGEEIIFIAGTYKF
jgi:hypothetical protein